MFLPIFLPRHPTKHTSTYSKFGFASCQSLESFLGFTLSVPLTMRWGYSWNQKQPFNSGSSIMSPTQSQKWFGPGNSMCLWDSGAVWRMANAYPQDTPSPSSSRGSRGTKAFANCQLDFFKCCPQLYSTQVDTESPKISSDCIKFPAINFGPRTNCLPFYMFYENASDASEMSLSSYKMICL